MRIQKESVPVNILNQQEQQADQAYHDYLTGKRQLGNILIDNQSGGVNVFQSNTYGHNAVTMAALMQQDSQAARNVYVEGMLNTVVCPSLRNSTLVNVTSGESNTFIGTKYPEPPKDYVDGEFEVVEPLVASIDLDK